MFCGIDPTRKECEITYEPITGDTEGFVINNQTLEVIDIAEDFDFTVATINIFDYEENPGIPYVDVQEFLYVIHEGLVYYTITKSNDQFTVAFVVNYTGNIFGSYSYELTINTDDNTIYYNDFGLSSEINISPSIDFNSDVYLSGGEYIEGGDLSKYIYLDDYSLQTASEDEVFFIPLYLANQLFTGDYLNTYISGELFYIVDDFYGVQEVFDNESALLMTDEENLIQNTIGFAGFFFDNYYGLKEFFEVESYLDEFETRGFYEAATIEELDGLLQQFVLDLDDLHTQIADYGASGDEVATPTVAPGTRIYDFYSVYFDDVCYDRDYAYDFREYDLYYILEINEFDLDMYDYLSETFVSLDPDKPIYIDLACNSGGSLGAVMELAAYLTNDIIPLNYYSPYTGEGYALQYQGNTDKALENEFFLLTSNMTYSAANLFTSMVKDNGWATIIGDDTSGGACAVLYTVFPNNMIMTYSSMMAMLDNNLEMIEMGIAPDYYDFTSLSANELIDNIYNYFERNVGWDYDVVEANDYSITVGTDWLEEGILDYFLVEVTSPTGDVTTYTYDTWIFEFATTFDNVDDYKIVITCYYVFDGVPLDYILYVKMDQ